MDNFYKLMLVTQKITDLSIDKYLVFIKTCLDSGITSLQLREKNASYECLLEFGTQLKKILSPYGVPLIINDHLQLAIDLEAEGVHLGQTDGDPVKARDILGPEKIIGLSIDSHENLMTANQSPLHYVGIGAIFETMHKKNVSKIWGIKGLETLSLLSKHPIVAIGGINESNAHSVMLAGTNGIAVIGALHHSANPALTVKKLLQIIESRGKNHDGIG